jgi:hypothetical protein
MAAAFSVNFATILGRMWPEWTGPEEPGAPSPFAWLDAGTLIERNNEQPTSCPYLVVSN